MPDGIKIRIASVSISMGLQPTAVIHIMIPEDHGDRIMSLPVRVGDTVDITRLITQKKCLQKKRLMN